MSEQLDLTIATGDSQGPYLHFGRYLGADPRLQPRHLGRLRRLMADSDKPMAIWIGGLENTQRKVRPVGAIAMYKRQGEEDGVDIAYQRLDYTVLHPRRRMCLAVGVAFAIAAGAEAIHLRETGVRYARSWGMHALLGTAYYYREFDQVHTGLRPEHSLYVGGAVMDHLAALGLTAATVEPTHPWRDALERAEAVGLSYRAEK